MPFRPSVCAQDIFSDSQPNSIKILRAKEIWVTTWKVRVTVFKPVFSHFSESVGARKSGKSARAYWLEIGWATTCHRR